MKIRRILIGSGLITVAALIIAGPRVDAQSGARFFQARLDGFHETPAISTNATGTFRATLNSAGTELAYELQYSGLEGGATLAAHVHLGQTSVPGGVMFFLCSGSKPACPNVQGTVTGTVTAADVIGPTGQGITAGQFDEVIRAMRNGASYANVHTTSFPGGEIRGQINDNDDNAQR